jgi:hypothetical protein
VIAIALVLIIVTLSLIVTRVATVALTLTGLSREAARFQARSALTGVGYTTSEAEKIVRHPVRRRVVMMLMLMGSAGVVSVIGSLMFGFARAEPTEAGLRVTVLIVGLVGLLWLAKTRWFDRGLQRIIRRLLQRYTDLDVRDYAGLLHVHGRYAVSELHVESGDWLAGQTLAQLALAQEGVLVLGVERYDGTYEGAPKGETLVHPGDVMVIYGPGERLEDLDRRPAGAVGERAHEDVIESGEDGPDGLRAV